MPKTAMNTPSILYRMVKNGVILESHDRRVVIAKGPFIIMAYRYLSLSLEDRRFAWITCPHGDVMPDEIETVMRQWHQPPKLAPDAA
jgi:hypothetical protein